jgi:hypothetical protein
LGDRELLEDPKWSTDPLPKFGTQGERMLYFIYGFENNPMAMASLVHEINPALDIRFILSDHVYEGQQGHLNTLKSKLRAHLYTRLAMLADLIFFDHFIGNARPGIGRDNLRWVRSRLILITGS